MGRGSRLQLDIVQEKNDTDFCRVLQGVSQGWLKSVFFLVIAMFSFAILYTMKSHASICF